MRFLAGLLGAVVGTALGGAFTLWLTAALSGGNFVAEGFGVMFFGPFGLLMGLIVGVLYGPAVYTYLKRPETEPRLVVKRRRLALLLILWPVLVTGLCFYGFLHSDDPPSDAAMLAHFHAHRAQFDELARMVQHDNPHGTGFEGKGLWRVDEDWTGPDKPETVGVSPARIADYRQKLRAAGVRRGFQAYDKGAIDFLYFGVGSAISSDTLKEFAYLPTPPAHVLFTLDKCQPDDKRGVDAYRHIDGPWYLHYEYLPG